MRLLERLLSIAGGVHPPERKEASREQPIASMPLPRRLYLPLRQHIGAEAEPVLGAGEPVAKGQLLARAAPGALSAPVHAPTSGTVLAIQDHPLPHPSGLPGPTIVLAPDGHDTWCELSHPTDPFDLAPEEVADRVAAAGVVGLGGATFPSGVKLHQGDGSIHTLVINGSECESYLSADDRIMRERPEEVVDGALIMAHALQAQRIVLAVERSTPEALQALEEITADQPGIKVASLPTRYPTGSEKHLVSTLFGKEVPAGRLTSALGVVVHNVATAHAVRGAVRLGRPLISRVVTVAGGALTGAANLEVPLGTPVADLLAHGGGLSARPERLIMGGPMMGQALAETRAPVVKGTNGLLALTQDEVLPRNPGPCIRCASCVEACPSGLMPLEMANRARNNDIQGAVDFGLNDCVACGACSFACPAEIPLVQYFLFAKGELARQRAEQDKQERTRRLAEARQERIAAQERAKEAKRQSASEQSRKGDETEAAQ